MKRIVQTAMTGLFVVSMAGYAGNVEERRYIHEGMTEAELMYKVGKPDHVEEVQNRFGAVLHKKLTYYPVAGDSQTMYIVTVSDGKVSGVEKKVVR